MWVPGLLFMFVGGVFENPWIQVVGGSWSHLQAAVSGLVSLHKPDIWKAVKGFWTCDPKMSDHTNADGRRPASSGSNNSILGTHSTNDVITVISAVSSGILSLTAEHGSSLMRRQSSFFSSLFYTGASRAKLERQQVTREIEGYLAAAEETVRTSTKGALEPSPEDEYSVDNGTPDVALGNTTTVAQEVSNHDKDMESCSDISSMEEDPTRDIGNNPLPTTTKRFSDTAATGKIGLTISVVRESLHQSMPNLEFDEYNPDIG